MCVLEWVYICVFVSLYICVCVVVFVCVCLSVWVCTNIQLNTWSMTFCYHLNALADLRSLLLLARDIIQFLNPTTTNSHVFQPEINHHASYTCRVDFTVIALDWNGEVVHAIILAKAHTQTT